MTEKELMEFRLKCLLEAVSLQKQNADGGAIDRTADEILKDAKKFYEFVSAKG